MDVVGSGLEVAIGVGGGVFCTAMFHRSYEASSNPRRGRFIVVTTGGLCLFAALAWILGEFNVLFLTGGFAFLVTFAVGASIWKPRSKPAPKKTSGQPG